MKRKIIAFLCALTLVFIALLGGCSFKNTKLGGDIDPNYVVTSNGGGAVHMGRYVYFINGYEDTADEDGKQNQWGNVVKGGIYRAELLGNAAIAYTYYDKITMSNVTVEGIKNFRASIPQNDDLLAIDLDFKSHKETIENEDATEEEIDVITVERLVPKKINNVKNRGIFIYDGYIYYTTAHNLKDRTGVVQSSLSDFMRTSLDGTKTQLICTSKTADVDYYIYHQEGITYLVLFEEGKLISYPMNSKKVQRPILISENVTGVVFGEKPVWYRGMETNSLSDFIFFTRTQNEDEIMQRGNTVEMVKPSGELKTEVIQNGNEVALVCIADELLFYKSGLEYRYTDFANKIEELTGEAPYKIELSHRDNLVTIDQTALSLADNWPTIMPRRSSPYSDLVEILAFSESEVRLFSNNDSGKVLLNEGIDPVHFEASTNTLFFTTKGEGETYKHLYLMNTQQSAEQKGSTQYRQLLKQTFKSDFFLDFAAGQIFFVAEELDELAKEYTFIRRYLIDSESKETFIGIRKDEDLPEEEEE